MKNYLAVLLAVIFVMIAAGVVPAVDEKKAQDTYTLKAPNGAVKFDHKKHSGAFKCEQCHRTVHQLVRRNEMELVSEQATPHLSSPTWMSGANLIGTARRVWTGSAETPRRCRPR